MDDSIQSIIMTLLYDAFPIESLRKSWKSLSNQDWIVFFRIFSLMGLVIQIGSSVMISIVLIFPRYSDNTGILSFVWTLTSRLFIVAAVILIATKIISRPIKEITGEYEPKRDHASGIPRQLYFTGIVWIGISFIFRYFIYILETPLIRNEIPKTVGSFIGIFLVDSLYFGGVMFGGGMILQTYIRRRGRDTS